MKEFTIKKGVTAVVIAGANKGDKGEVLAVDRKNERVFLRGINIRKKTVRKNQENPNGGIIEIEAPIHISNVMHEAKYEARKTKKAANE